MDIRNIQPHRKDLLINNEWGIPKENISKEEAGLSGLKYYKGYWVKKEEKKRLKAEYNAYNSIYLLARFLILFSIYMLFSTFSVSLIFPIFFPAVGLALLSGSIGLFCYNRWGRNISTVALVSMFFIPFLLKGAPDKGAPIIWWVISIVSLYSLHNKKARQIFNEPKALGLE